ncbi:xanthine/uracil/thiamine/ascorbate permease family protein [Klebsiella pneumoniae subsp. rhinoscleromatis]|nr:xanthine/uracil/thiamine/ascorbate permease family protein [Klebsiella pneumoniae subsp. rhinoscleromatis]
MADNTLHSSARANWLERRFALRSRGGTLRTECLAGITGFLAAAYLLVVIPGLLAIGGMDKGAATTGTILVFRRRLAADGVLCQPAVYRRPGHWRLGAGGG